jgi:ubiquinol-cytochrome c reductase cytochrome b subunit
MDLRDEYALQQVKAKLGGSVKLRSGARAIRYRLHHKKGMEELIQRINGEIRLGARKNQLQKLCTALNIPYAQPTKAFGPESENAWFAGFFDADGTITLSIKNGSPQVTIAVSAKYSEDLFAFKEVFCGNIYQDKASNTYKWSIQNKVDMLNFLQYIKKYPCRSSKKARLHLLPRFFEYKDARMYRASSDSLQYKAWLKFLDKWKAREA